eukprot:CAMPEP_0170153198 /NCGR_PEP_ID=MMETSP0033_2-20121228/54591_1 /TAXON_ID=195969 /ORGANISM="Dolichomastix tenuilepis, Strain CCMP3274" /LENGTH=350 /DNA_ID=CAMNT_0010390393 /DNA_START=112 /DNA_END=1159 /DNA_ORIENTATION=-
MQNPETVSVPGMDEPWVTPAPESFWRSDGDREREEAPSAVVAEPSAPATTSVVITADVDLVPEDQRLALMEARALALRAERVQAALEEDLQRKNELEEALLRAERKFKVEQATRKRAQRTADELTQAIESERKARLEAESEARRLRAHLEASVDYRNFVRMEKESITRIRRETDIERESALETREQHATADERVRAECARDLQELVQERAQELRDREGEVTKTARMLESRERMLEYALQHVRTACTRSQKATLDAQDFVELRKRDLEAQQSSLENLADRLYVGREKHERLADGIRQTKRVYDMLALKDRTAAAKPPHARAAAPPRRWRSGGVPREQRASAPAGPARARAA